MDGFSAERQTKVKIIQDPELSQPELYGDEYGFTIKLPTFKKLDEGGFVFEGAKFSDDNTGKSKLGRLFRASVCI